MHLNKSGVWGMEVPGIDWEWSFCYYSDILALELMPSLSLPLSYGRSWVVVLFHVQQWWFYLSPLGPVAPREGLGTLWFLGPLLSQALFCGWAGPCFIRIPGCWKHVQPLNAGAPLLSLPCLCCLVSPGSCCLKPPEKAVDDFHNVIPPSSTLLIVQSPNLGHLHLSSVAFWDCWFSLSKEIN